MNGQLYPAVVAVLGAAVLALGLFVPFVAVQYRRHGTLRFSQLLIWTAVLVYALAVLAYTLLPLPTVTPALCAGGGADVQLHPGQVVHDIARGVARDHGLLRNSALQQAVFNVALFVPFGAFVRYLRGARVVIATAVGLGASLLVELTQLTGNWFAYPCAYRVFDVDDLITNTTGALLGALLAPALALVPGQHRDDDPGQPRPVTARRRLLGMLCDWAVSQGTGIALAFTYEVVFDTETVPARVDSVVQTILVSVVPALVLLAVLLGSHRSPGEAVVRLRPRAVRRAPAIVLRWLSGIGGYLLLSAGESKVAGLLAVVSVVAVLVTRDHRGFAYRVVGWEVVDDRSPSLDDAARSAADDVRAEWPQPR